MGFGAGAAAQALQHSGGDVAAAVGWLAEHTDKPAAAPPPVFERQGAMPRRPAERMAAEVCPVGLDAMGDADIGRLNRVPRQAGTAAGFCAAEVAACQADPLLSLDGKSSAALLLDLLRRRRAQCTVEQEYQNLALAITETYGAETDSLATLKNAIYYDVWRRVSPRASVCCFKLRKYRCRSEGATAVNV
jgi:hypothetical protein